MKNLTLLVMVLATLVAICCAQAASPSVSAAASGECEDRCDRVKGDCRLKSTAAYVRCGQQGGTDTECQRIRSLTYRDCMQSGGCWQCYDARVGLLWYCNCGRPWDESLSGGGSKGTTIETFNTYENNEPVPYEYSWEGMGCDVNPEICDPNLWL